MMNLQEILFGLILFFIIIEFVIERILHHLNMNSWSKELPNELKAFYNHQEYLKAMNYALDNARISNFSVWINFAFIIFILLTKSIGYIDSLIRQVSENEIIMSLLFFGLAGIASYIISLPLSLYSTFVIEEKYGFNKTTGKIFILDSIKSILLAAIFGGGLLSLIIYIYEQTGSFFWIISWAVFILFTVFISMFYSKLIVPLFNKQKPLEEGEIRNEVIDFAAKVGFIIKNIFVIDGSKRSTKANAYFTGFGRNKRIVLYDNLINDYKTDEVVAVLAHEIGHSKLKHTIIGLFMGIFQTGILLYILSIFISADSSTYKAIAEVFGAKSSFYISVIGFGLLYSPISLFTSLLMNYISRRNEYAADKFAAQKYNGKALGSALIKLSNKNLSNLTPHPLFVIFYHSHPTLLQRLKALEENDSH